MCLCNWILLVKHLTAHCWFPLKMLLDCWNLQSTSFGILSSSLQTSAPLVALWWSLIGLCPLLDLARGYSHGDMVDTSSLSHCPCEQMLEHISEM